MKLVVGLGNPGKEYENTRHNIGFFIIDEYLKQKGVFHFSSKLNGLYADMMIDGQKVLFLKPQSYMNLSGEVVRKFVNFYKIDIQDILVISDDLDLNVGNFKLRAKGSSGGHNGLKNIENHLGTQCYKRLKIGISNHRLIDTKDYVLSRFDSHELAIYQELKKTIFEVLDDYFKEDFNDLMSKYNRKNR